LTEIRPVGALHIAAPRSKAKTLMLLFGFLSFALAGCISAEQRAASDREQCHAQGYAPSSAEFNNCLVGAAARHDEAEARQSARMRQAHEQEVDNFLTSTSIIP
jgi:hypothetical protein